MIRAGRCAGGAAANFFAKSMRAPVYSPLSVAGVILPALRGR